MDKRILFAALAFAALLPIIFSYLLMTVRPWVVGALFGGLVASCGVCYVFGVVPAVLFIGAAYGLTLLWHVSRGFIELGKRRRLAGAEMPRPDDFRRWCLKTLSSNGWQKAGRYSAPEVDFVLKKQSVGWRAFACVEGSDLLTAVKLKLLSDGARRRRGPITVIVYGGAPEHVLRQTDPTILTFLGHMSLDRI